IALGIGIVISMVIYSVSFAVMVAVAKKRKSEANITLANPWMSSAIVSPVVLCLSLLVIFLLSIDMLPLWGFQLPTLEVMVLLSTIGIIAAIVVVVVSEYISPTPEKMNPPSDTRGRVIFFVVIVLLASIGEEMLFRGFLQNILDNSLLLAIDLGWFSITSGAIVSAIVFGMIHIAPAKQMGASVPVLVFSAAILGLIAGISLTISGSILLPIIIHIEFNLVGFVLGIRSKPENS
ncbi:MAG: CPBP family intramembrane metalloprotease, partial [Candidatus Thorarchaeota archaeon]|nr:CPBP family intramembrane metalloprotease [Candidatus Thorarchaeota archaeon]